MPTVPSLPELNSWLAELLQAAHYSHERNGIWKPTGQPVNHLLLALEPSKKVVSALAEMEPDALWLHRAFDMPIDTLPAATGLIAHHLPFDETMTMGLNPYLAQALGMSSLVPFGKKRGRAIGMIGDVPQQTLESFRLKLQAEFDGLEAAVILNGEQFISRVAVAGAMTEALLKGSLKNKAQVYVTGALRPRAMQRICPFRLPIIATGHARCETWGLKEVARLIQANWPEMKVTVLSGNK
jgi:putative NIF3 family GTP cyclohydrolase 1 type 2